MQIVNGIGERIGPRHPMPFPQSGRKVHLITCPTCKGKGLMMFFAPDEQAYPTQCVKCGQKALIHPKGRDSLYELEAMQREGFHNNPLLRRVRPDADDPRGYLDASRLADQARDRHSLGYRRWWRR